MIKDTYEQPNEEVHRARFARVCSTGASVPEESDCPTLSASRYVHQHRSFLKSCHSEGFYLLL